ncbi:MAG TPA: zinc-binding dehydrogenase [Chloroflexota bacterium]|nr:zinc-binding dehydrogenase [Chloroflexota bacterium]HEX2988506.1 zinc-binding dehydrogenase [Chloroflexota bacterium]
MKAIAKTKPTEPGVNVVEAPAPTISAPDDVLVKVQTTSISGSEINIWRGTYRRPNGEPVAPGRVLGYEFAGIVEKAGAAAKEAGFLPGRRVALGSPFVPCTKCEPCSMGFVNRCRNWGHVGITRDGSDAELACVPTITLQLLDDKVDSLDAAFLNTAGLAVRAVDRSHLVPGDRIAVVGPGPVGLFMLQAARAAGAAWAGVVGLPSDASRLKIAAQLGADACFTASDSTVAEIKAATEGLGPEVVFEAAGSPEGIKMAVDLVRVGGTVILAGLPPQKIAPFESIRVARDEISMIGAEGNLPADRRRALRLFASGDLKARPLVTHRFSMDKAEEAFQVAASGAACKVVFDI